jgi:CxxC-x17-CxxC domain-containing protein
MTDVICSTCGKDCQVPFKPTSSKPVYCDDCFSKKEKGGSSRGPSNKDLEVINEKLDKIMAALKIETTSDEE